MNATKQPDQDTSKGATEVEDHATPGNIGLQNQLGHRDQDPMLKGADTDFPEPGENPEHSGEPEDVAEVKRSA
jgi:hypothetical protein